MSDTHFYHKKVIDYAKRPFSSIDEMNQKIINNINDKVQPNDIIFILGDFVFGEEKVKEILSRINCKNVHLVLGNHDVDIAKSKELKSLFKSVNNYLEISVQDLSLEHKYQRIVLCHYPILEWNRGHHGSWMLHGHCHGQLTIPEQLKNKRILDVGVDNLNFSPISYEELKKLFKNKENIKHHD